MGKILTNANAVHKGERVEMEIKDIIIDHLKKNGFDGLVNLDGECGCDIDDLAPCEHISLDCQPAYKRIGDCKECKTKCDGYDDSDDTYCFSINKQKK